MIGSKPKGERMKYILIGLAIGIVIGIAVTLLLMNLRLLGPLGMRGVGDFVRPENFTGNFTRPFPRGV